MTMPTNKPANRFDEQTKEWLTSKTFKIIIALGCGLILLPFLALACFSVFGVGILGADILRMLNGQSVAPIAVTITQPVVAVVVATETPSAILPYIVDEIQPEKMDENTKALVTAWLVASAPAQTPYWYVTGFSKNGDVAFVSLAGANPTIDPSQKIDIAEGPIIWTGSVKVENNIVTLLSK